MTRLSIRSLFSLAACSGSGSAPGRRSRASRPSNGDGFIRRQPRRPLGRSGNRRCRSASRSRASPRCRCRARLRSGASMVFLSTLAMRRATTWAARKSVSVNTAKIELSASRQAKSTWRISRASSRAASRLTRRSLSSKQKRAIDRPTPRFSASSTARLRSRQNASWASRPVSGSSMPLASSDLSMRRSRWPKACSRTNGRKRSTRRCGPSAMRSRLGKCSAERLDHAGMAAEHGDRQIAKPHVLGQHGQQRFDDARAKAVADDHAVDIARVERARRALDAERADQADLLADARPKAPDRSGRGRRPARSRRRADRSPAVRAAARRATQACGCGASTVPCSARMRSAEPSRRTMRSTGALAAIASASGTVAAPSSRDAGDDRR